MILEKFQNLVSIGRCYRIITRSWHLLRDMKEKGRSKYEVGNLILLDLQYFEVSNRRPCSTIRTTSRVHSVYIDFYNL